MRKNALTAIGFAIVLATAVAAIRMATRAPITKVIGAADKLPFRAIEARLSGGFAFKPLAPVMRGSNERADVALLAAASVLQKEQALSPSHQQAFGAAQLLLGETNHAVETLEALLRTSTGREDPAIAINVSNDASLLSDLSAVYLAVARSGRQPRAYILAAEAAERAWSLERTPEIAWNRALAIQALHLREDADAAWSDYLFVDQRSDWMSEAAGHRVALAHATNEELWEIRRPQLERAVRDGNTREVTRIVQALPQKTRMSGEQVYLPQWARDDRGDLASPRLAYCRAIGNALHELHRDALLYDTIQHLDRATPMQRAVIVRGLSRYANALDLLDGRHAAEARSGLQLAYDDLRLTGSPFAQNARYWLAAAESTASDTKTFDTWLADGSLDEHTRPALTAQVYWSRGLRQMFAGRPHDAVRDYGRALELFELLDETELVAALHARLTEAYEDLGDAGEAWRHRFAGLALFEKSGSTHPTLTQMRTACAVVAYAQHAPHVALLYLNRQVAALKPVDYADQLSRALLWRSRAHRALGDAVAAAADLRVARAAAARIKNVEVRADALTSPDIVIDRLAQARDAAARDAIVLDAIEHAKRKQLRFRLARLYREQARELLKNGRAREAEEALFASIDELEQQRGAIAQDEHRSTFLAARQEIYEELAWLLCQRGEWRNAFAVMERSRARTLLDRVAATGTVQVQPLDAIRASLAPRALLVEYATFADRLGIWLVSRDSARFTAVPVEREALVKLVDEFRVAIRDHKNADALRIGHRLHEQLIAPWSAEAARAESIIFVPGEVLSGLPFAALSDGREYLVQRHAVSIAPSANVFAVCASRSRERSSGTTLVVAPGTTTAGPRGEALLVASRGEAFDVARQYDRRVILEGPHATRDEFVARAAEANIIHFGGHAFTDSDAPALVFAGDASMHASEIAALKLPRTNVVVLAACGSGTDEATNAQGASSLARAFLAAGAPVVIGSYWPVEDVATARFSVLFHSFLGRGHRPVEALRLAQLQMLASREARTQDVSSWGAFAAMGGESSD